MNVINVSKFNSSGLMKMSLSFNPFYLFFPLYTKKKIRTRVYYNALRRLFSISGDYRLFIPFIIVKVEHNSDNQNFFNLNKILIYIIIRLLYFIFFSLNSINGKLVGWDSPYLIA